MNLNTDILTTFRLDALESQASIAGLVAHGETLREATINVFRLLPKCERLEAEDIITLVGRHPESVGRTLIMNILRPENHE